MEIKTYEEYLRINGETKKRFPNKIKGEIQGVSYKHNQVKIGKGIYNIDDLLLHTRLGNVAVTNPSRLRDYWKKQGRPAPKQQIQLSDEQKYAIKMAKEGHDILIDACIGSGKTTTIQQMMLELQGFREDGIFKKRLLYLTYNKLLKLDAKSKIAKSFGTVSNFHGYAYGIIKNRFPEEHVTNTNAVEIYNKLSPPVDKYDIILVDEYQDLSDDTAKMLEHILECNSDAQIIAVGDMCQKISDTSKLNPQEFILSYMKKPLRLKFSNCYRISQTLANWLGKIWRKKIVGINTNCKVHILSKEDTVKYLSDINAGDVLCLGKRDGIMVEIYNELEKIAPDRYSKNTTYISIKDEDSNVTPDKDANIFTTYDSAKGLERDVCIVCDFDKNYLESRLKAMDTNNVEILRNIFCVAASRGKSAIIFVDSGENNLLYPDRDYELKKIKPIPKEKSFYRVSDMYSHKYPSDVKSLYNLLDIQEIDSGDKEEISIVSKDGYIDLSPCIGIYQEARFFKNYDINAKIDFDILYAMAIHSRGEKTFQELYDIYKGADKLDLNKKILLSMSIETRQLRYYKSANPNFITETDYQKIAKRLQSIFKGDERTQVQCGFKVKDRDTGEEIFIVGQTDAVKDGMIYELKFVSEVKEEHFLQLARYMYLLGYDVGRLYNTKTNQTYEIRIKDRKKFLKKMIQTVTKQRVKNFSVE